MYGMKRIQCDYCGEEEDVPSNYLNVFCRRCGHAIIIPKEEIASDELEALLQIYFETDDEEIKEYIVQKLKRAGYSLADEDNSDDGDDEPPAFEPINFNWW